MRLKFVNRQNHLSKEVATGIAEVKWKRVRLVIGDKPKSRLAFEACR